MINMRGTVDVDRSETRRRQPGPMRARGVAAPLVCELVPDQFNVLPDGLMA